MPLLHPDEYTLDALQADVAYQRTLSHQRQLLLMSLLEGLDTYPDALQWRQYPRRYTVKEGDTLPKIATELYWRPDRWQEIARLNQLAPPYTLLPGQTLVLPE